MSETRRVATCSACSKPQQDSDDCRASGLCLLCLHGPVPGRITTPSPDTEWSRCMECGMRVSEAGEYHPYLFCVIYKDGIRDPAAFLAQSGWHR